MLCICFSGLTEDIYEAQFVTKEHAPNNLMQLLKKIIIITSCNSRMILSLPSCFSELNFALEMSSLILESINFNHLAGSVMHLYVTLGFAFMKVRYLRANMDNVD